MGRFFLPHETMVMCLMRRIYSSRETDLFIKICSYHSRIKTIEARSSFLYPFEWHFLTLQQIRIYRNSSFIKLLFAYIRQYKILLILQLCRR